MDNDSVQAKNFFDENIERLLKQVEYGDESFSFLAMYSFIEGYLRKRLNINYRWNKDFPEIIELFIQNQNRRSDCPYGSKESFDNLNDLIKYHGSFDEKSLGTGTDTNHIRHEFSKMMPQKLSIVALQFYTFFKYRSIDTSKIEKILNCSSVQTSMSSIPIEPPKESDIYSINENLFNEYSSARGISRETKNWINELSKYLIECKAKRDYEARVFNLSKEQKEIINNNIMGLSQKDGKSLLIKGGPGTGKTLILISALLKFLDENKNVVLLTYYDCLKKYISYLFNNSDILLHQLSIRARIVESLESLNKAHIFSFDDYFSEIIGNHLGKYVYNLSKRQDPRIGKIFKKYASNENEKEKLYKLALTVWSNYQGLKDVINEKTLNAETQYLTKLDCINKEIERLDEYPDVFAYYKFLDDKIEVRQKLPEHILIDEAQDLTNTQIIIAGKFSKCGCVFAGDMTQSIRNESVSWTKLGIDIKGGRNYSASLINNYRSSSLIQKLGEEYKKNNCIIKDYTSVKTERPGPPPQLFITKDTADM